MTVLYLPSFSNGELPRGFPQWWDEHEISHYTVCLLLKSPSQRWLNHHYQSIFFLNMTINLPFNRFWMIFDHHFPEELSITFYGAQEAYQPTPSHRGGLSYWAPALYQWLAPRVGTRATRRYAVVAAFREREWLRHTWMWMDDYSKWDMNHWLMDFDLDFNNDYFNGLIKGFDPYSQ
jgi:hypothetical protein